MRWYRLNRRIHYWATVVVALPLVIMIATGVVLQLKKQLSWVQPETQTGSGEIAIGFDTILARVQALPQFSVNGWEDIDRLDVRPNRGVVKVRLENRWEIQLDLANGELLHVAYRRSDVIEALHDGSFFGGDVVKLGIFLPAAVVLFAVWVTGLWMFLRPLLRRNGNGHRD